MLKVSYRILKAIEKSGMTYEELSKLTKISKSALQRYATGGTDKIPIDCAEAIAVALGISPVALVGWDTKFDAKSAVLSPSIYISAEQQELLKVTQGVSGEIIKSISNLALVIAANLNK